MKVMRKIFAVFLVIMLCMMPISHVSASEIDHNSPEGIDYGMEGITVSEELDAERASVDPVVVEQILESGICAYNEDVAVSGLTVDEIDEELSHIYLDLEKATMECEKVDSEENRNKLMAINDRIQMLEADLQQYGFKFLSDAEAAALLGISDVSTASVYDEPPANWNTQNARVVVSSVNTVTLSTGEEIPYYYVTAYNTTNDSNLVSMPTIPIEAKNTFGDFVNALIQTYAAKVVGATIGAYSKVLEWLPYEMITYTNAPAAAAADYTVEAVYTSTARWIWAYSEYGGRYYHEATVHRTSVANHHVIRYSYNGVSRVDSEDENYMVYTPHFSSPGALVKERWENGETSILLERVANIKYYYKQNENATQELVQSVAVPYLQYAIELN